jgi:transcriptional regulator with XRE-family HTH domain
MTEPVGLDAAIASQVRRYRLAKNWSVRQLAEECQKLGMSSLTEASLGNIERGQKAGSGAKRGVRRVLVEELVVLAKALDVPPILLVFPVDKAPTIEVTPGHVMPTWDALRWFTAEGPIAPDDIDRMYGAGQYDPRAEKYGHGKRDPITGLYEWYDAPDAAWEQGAAPVVLLRQLFEQVHEWSEHASQADEERRARMLAAIRGTIAEMRRRGHVLPALPAGLSPTDDQRKGGASRGGPDQAD